MFRFLGAGYRRHCANADKALLSDSPNKVTGQNKLAILLRADNRTLGATDC